MAGEVDIIVSALNNASGPLGGVLGSLNDLEGASSSLMERGLAPLQTMLGTGLKVAAAGAAAAMAGLAAGLGSSISKAADMEQGVADIAAQMGTTSEETAQLKDLITNLGLDPKLKVTATEAAAAIGQLGTAGESVKDILNGAARNTVLLANATGIDFAGAASMATDVSNLWKIKAEDLGKAVNGISSAVINSKFTIQDYQYALGAAGGVAATVGVDFNDFNTTVAAISPFFAKGADAGNSFKVMLQNLVPKSDATKDKMEELGLITKNWKKAADELSHSLGHVIPADATSVYNNFIALMEKQGFTAGQAAKKFGAFIAQFKENQFFDAQGNMKDMGDIVQVLHDKLGDLSEMDLNDALHKVFGQDSMRAGAALTRMTKEEFEKLQETMSHTDAEDLAATRMDTFKGAMEIFSGVVETLQMNIGDKFLPQLTKLTRQFTDMLSAAAPQILEWAGNLANRFAALTDQWMPILITKFKEWWEWLKQTAIVLIDAGVQVWNFITSLTKLLQPVIDILSRFVGLKEILIGVAAAFGVSAVAALASFMAAITPVIAVIGTAITVGGALYGSWNSNFGGIRDMVGGVLNYLYDRFHLLGDFIRLFGVGALQEIVSWATGTQTQFTNLDKIWTQLKLTVQVVLNDLVTYIRSNLPIWTAQLQAWGNAAWQWIVNAAPLVLAKLQEWGNSLYSWVTNNLPGWTSRLVAWGNAAWQWIVGAMPTVLAKLQEWASALYGWLVVNLPVWVTKLAAWGISLFQWITDNIPATIDALTKWIDGMLTYGNTTGTSKVQEMLYKLGQAMLTALGAVGISLGKLALTVAGDLLLNFAAGILNWMGIDVSVKSLHDHMIGLIDMLANALSGKAALIGGAIAAFLIPGFASIVSTVVGMVVPALGSLLTGLAALLGPIGLAIAAVVALYVAWQNNFLGIRDLTAQAFDYIKGIFTNFPATLEGVKNTLYDWGVSAMGKLREGFVSAQNMVRNGLDVVMDFIQQGRDQRLPPFAQSMYEAGANAFFKLGQGAQAVKDGVIGQFNLVMTDIQNQGLGFAGGALLGRMYEGGRGFILQVGAGIASASPNMLTDLNNAFSGLVGKFNYWHDNLAPHFLGSAQDLAAKIGAGFAGFSIGGALDTAFGKLRDAYNYWHDNLSPHFFGSAKDLANSLINGLTSGILDGIGKVIGAIQGVTDALPQWVKDKLGIHSPSTVFQGFGQNIMEGMALGIQQLAAMPQQAIAAATAALTDPLANMQLPQQNGGQQITQNKTTYNDWTVNMPAGGGSSEEQFAGMFRQLNVLYAQ